MSHKNFRILLIAFTIGMLLVTVNWATVSTQQIYIEQFTAVEEVREGQNCQSLAVDAASGNITLYPSADAPVVEGEPSTTHATDLLEAGYDDGAIYPTGRVRSYITFDFSCLPANSTVISAKFSIQNTGGQDFPGVSRTVSFHRVTGSWSESGITWNNRPGYAESVGSISSTYDFTGRQEFDVTSLVSNWINGNVSNYGIVAVGPESEIGAFRRFVSRQYVGSPELTIRITPSPVLDVWPGKVTHEIPSALNGATVSLNVGNVTYDSLNWTAVSGGAPWLSIDTSSGSVTPTSSGSIPISINIDGLAPGTYSEQITVSSNSPGALGSPIAATVSIDVLDMPFSIFLPAVMGGTGSGQPNNDDPEIHAILVGVSDYEFYSSNDTLGRLPDEWGDGDLNYPSADALAMRTALIDSGAIASNVATLTDSQASLANIQNEFVNAAATVDSDDIFIFYFSGHGAQNPDWNGDESDSWDEIIMPYDATLHSSGSYFVNVFSDDELEAFLNNINAGKIVVIIDSCYSGSLASTASTSSSHDLRARGVSLPNMPNQQTSPNANDAAMAELVKSDRLIITGGTGDQLTYESSALGHGVFTYFFLEGLEEVANDANENGRISAEEAYWFTKDAVDAWMCQGGENQNPAINDQIHGQVDLSWLP